MGGRSVFVAFCGCNIPITLNDRCRSMMSVIAFQRQLFVKFRPLTDKESRSHSKFTLPLKACNRLLTVN